MGSPKKWVAFIKPGAEIELKLLSFRPGIVEDTYIKRAWEIVPSSKYHWIKAFGKSIYAPVVDYDRAISIDLTKQENGDYLLTGDDRYFLPKDNPARLIGTMIDAIMVTAASQMTPSNKEIFNFGLLMIGLGIVIKFMFH